MLEPRIHLGGDNHPGAVRKAGQQRGGLAQHVLDPARPVGGGDLGVDPGALLGAHRAHLHQGIDEEAQAQVGGHAAGTGVRREDQTRLFQIHHDIAHRGRGKTVGQDARDGARAHRLAGLQIGVDQPPEDVARTLVEAGDTRKLFVKERLGGIMLMPPM